MHLTNNSKKLLYILYNEYINRRNHNVPAKRAVHFDNAKSVHENFMPDEQLEDYLRDAAKLPERADYSGNGGTSPEKSEFKEE